jgi:hypothetical protein
MLPALLAALARSRTLAVALPCLVLMVGLAGCGSTGKPVAQRAASSAALVPIGAGLSGPAGLHARVYAHGPLTVADMAFDSHGRLWVSAAGLEGHAHDGVYLIAHAGAPPMKVVQGLNDPLGLLWYQGRLYVASVGRVDAYGEFEGTRFRTHTTILHGPVAGGENNLMALSPGGRIVMGVTATCDHCTPTSKWSGAVVSFLPDGGDLRLYAARIRAPFGLAYFPGTADLFVSMNQRDDLEAATPGDWLAQVSEGEDWRFPGCYGQGGAACAGVPRPIAVLDRHAAVGGVAILTGQLGPTVGTAALVPEWQSAKVQRVALIRTASASTPAGVSASGPVSASGSVPGQAGASGGTPGSASAVGSATRDGTTYTGAVTPFLTGMRNPLAITLAADGTLLVADWATGTIYSVSSH